MNTFELEAVVEKSNVIFKMLTDKHSNLSGHLVLSSPYGQCALTANPVEILNLFPQMITESKQKYNSLHLLQKINDIESGNKKNRENTKLFKKWKLQLGESVKNLEIDQETFVEIRFDNGDLDLIFELQKDELISQKHTPQTKASIRIVLGTVGVIFLMNK
jgi:hypothetical protein